MARTYTIHANKPNVLALLERLSDPDTDSGRYAETMYQLGLAFGEIIHDQVKHTHDSISLATTVEDADYLGKGIIDVLEAGG